MTDDEGPEWSFGVEDATEDKILFMLFLLLLLLLLLLPTSSLLELSLEESLPLLVLCFLEDFLFFLAFVMSFYNGILKTSVFQRSQVTEEW